MRGERILEVLFNGSPREARRSRLIVEPDQRGLLTLTASPRLDLQMMWRLALVAEDLPEPPPAYLLDQSYQLTLEGPREDQDLGARLEELPRWKPEDRGGLRLERGELSLYASAASAPLDVRAGQCLLRRDPAPTDHPILGALELAACPVDGPAAAP